MTDEQDDEIADPDCLINRVQRHMETDDCDPMDQSARLEQLYRESTAKQREAIDDALVCLCGWRLKSLIDGTDR